MLRYVYHLLLLVCISMDINIKQYMHTHTHTHTHTYIHIYIYTYIHIYIYTHAHTHTFVYSNRFLVPQKRQIGPNAFWMKRKKNSYVKNSKRILRNLTLQILDHMRWRLHYWQLRYVCMYVCMYVYIQ